MPEAFRVRKDGDVKPPPGPLSASTGLTQKRQLGNRGARLRSSSLGNRSQAVLRKTENIDSGEGRRWSFHTNSCASPAEVEESAGAGSEQRKCRRFERRARRVLALNAPLRGRNSTSACALLEELPVRLYRRSSRCARVEVALFHRAEGGPRWVLLLTDAEGLPKS